MVGIHFADQKDLIAAIGQGFTDELFSAAFPVHLRRVDDVCTQVECKAQRCDFAVSQRGVLAHAPGAEAQSRNALARRKSHRLHFPPSKVPVKKSKLERRKEPGMFSRERTQTS